MSVYESFEENYDDVVFLHDNEEIDYEFFMGEYVRILNARGELSAIDATRIYHDINEAIRKSQRMSRRTFDFTDTNTSESSETSEGENGMASSREVFCGAEVERFTGRLESRLRLLLISERGISLNTIFKRKKFMRKVLGNSKLSVAQVLPIIRRPPPQAG